MAVSLLIFRHAYTSAFNKLMDVDSDTWKCSLHTVTYVPNQDTHDFFNDATNELAASGNYTAGGATISPGVVSTVTTKQYNIDFSDAVWAALTMSSPARIAVGYDSTPGTAATNPVLFYVDFGADQSVSGATFTIQWAAPLPGGVASFSVT
jgi:hypothetical protein